MENYEACVILNAQLPEETTEELIKKLEGLLVSGGAEMRTISRWGRRKLAYPIEKTREGYYVIFYFGAPDGKCLPEFEQSCRYEENILRYLVFNVPTKKRDQEVRQLVPEPGWLSSFSMDLQPVAPRRRREGGPRHYSDRRDDSDRRPDSREGGGDREPEAAEKSGADQQPAAVSESED